jgi:hypothetical protein
VLAASKTLISRLAVVATVAALAAAGAGAAFASGGSTSGGGGGGTTTSGGGGSTTVKVDTIKVSKCYYNAGGEMLIKAASSDPTATLSLYGPDDSFIEVIQNGGGSRYGGTVAGWYRGYDPVFLTIRSSSGGSVVCFTTPFAV